MGYETEIKRRDTAPEPQHKELEVGLDDYSIQKHQVELISQSGPDQVSQHTVDANTVEYEHMVDGHNQTSREGTSHLRPEFNPFSDPKARVAQRTNIDGAGISITYTSTTPGVALYKKSDIQRRTF
jgi:hypothetical protein